MTKQTSNKFSPEVRERAVRRSTCAKPVAVAPGRALQPLPALTQAHPMAYAIKQVLVAANVDTDHRHGRAI